MSLVLDVAGSRRIYQLLLSSGALLPNRVSSLELSTLFSLPLSLTNKVIFKHLISLKKEAYCSSWGYSFGHLTLPNGKRRKIIFLDYTLSVSSLKPLLRLKISKDKSLSNSWDDVIFGISILKDAGIYLRSRLGLKD